MKSVVVCLLLGVTFACATKSSPWGELQLIDLEPRPNINEAFFNHDMEGRITNGEVAERKQFPYQVGLMMYIGDKGAWCGGTIISNRYILTAAHCLDPVTSGVDVYIGAWNVKDLDDKHMQVIYVPRTDKSMIVHENWDQTVISSDIALLKLPSRLRFNCKSLNEPKLLMKFKIK